MYTEADGRKKRDELEIAERKERRRHWFWFLRNGDELWSYKEHWWRWKWGRFGDGSSSSPPQPDLWFNYKA